MARKRMISPEIWDSENFSKLSILARLVFIGMFSNADDEGRGRAKASFLKSKLFPYDESMRVADIEAALDEVAANMSVAIYSHDGNEYYSFDNWGKWQKVDRPSPSNIIPFNEECETIRGTLREHSENIRKSFDECSTNARRMLAPNRIEKKRIEKKTTEDNAREAVAVSQELIDFYQENISRQYITPRELDNISFWVDKVDANVIMWAMEQAVDRSVRNWSYIEKILQNHYNAGRTTLAAIQLANKSFKAKKNQPQGVYDDNDTDYDEIEKIVREKM